MLSAPLLSLQTHAGANRGDALRVQSTHDRFGDARAVLNNGNARQILQRFTERLAALLAQGGTGEGGRHLRGGQEHRDGVLPDRDLLQLHDGLGQTHRVDHRTPREIHDSGDGAVADGAHQNCDRVGKESDQHKASGRIRADYAPLREHGHRDRAEGKARNRVKDRTTQLAPDPRAARGQLRLSSAMWQQREQGGYQQCFGGPLPTTRTLHLCIVRGFARKARTISPAVENHPRVVAINS